MVESDPTLGLNAVVLSMFGVKPLLKDLNLA